MKKEVLIAIIIGFSIGLIITYGIHTARTSLAQRDTGETALSPSSNSSLVDPAGDGTHSLIIYSPQQSAIVDTETLQISGISTPRSMIAALSAYDESSTVADDQGSFLLDIELVTGANIIDLSSFAVTGELAQESLEIVYTSVDLTLSDVASGSATEE